MLKRIFYGGTLLCALVLAACSPTEASPAPDKPSNPTSDAPSVTVPDEAPDPTALLQRSMAYVAGLGSLAVDADLEKKLVVGTDRQTVELDVRLVLEGEDNLYFSSATGGQEARVYNTADTQVIHFVEKGQYIERDPHEGRAETVAMLAGQEIRYGSIWLGQWLHNDPALLKNLQQTSYLGKEPLAREDGEVPCHRLGLAYKNYDVEAWIAGGDQPLVHRFVVDLTRLMAPVSKPDRELKLEIIFDLHNWEPGADVGPGRFAFAAPAGAKKVEPPKPQARQARQESMVGQEAPPFTLDTLDGGTLDLASHKGKEVVVLDFWATWCGPCRQAMPVVDSVADAYKDKEVAFYAVNLKESPEKVRKFVENNELELPIALDRKGEAQRLYRASSIPRTVVIGKEGKIQSVHRGFSPQLGKQLSDELDTLLAGESLAEEEA